MAQLRLFASVREAAGTGRAIVDGATVAEVLDQARTTFGPDFARLVAESRVWLNGEAAEGSEPVVDGDEIAVLPPVSGGC
jgi:molybdopterin converting factor small subunit